MAALDPIGVEPTLSDVESPLRAARPGGDLEEARARAAIAGRIFADDAGARAGEQDAEHRGTAETERARFPRIGSYRLERRLGAGAMGTVYEAWDPRLERYVAIKVLHGACDDDPNARRRLVREARALARVSAPNVIVVFEVGFFDERGEVSDDSREREGLQAFVVMERVRGVSLAEALEGGPAEGGRAERTAWALDLFIQAGVGLDAAHTAGLVHRDFKPANVLVGEDGRVRVVDFGLARADRGEDLSRIDEGDGARPLNTSLSLHTKTGALIGTPRYMAPEQLDGESATAASDQYAFCLALVEAVAGRTPLPITTIAARRAAMITGPDPKVLDALPASLAGCMRRGLAIQPDARFSTMRALVDELRAIRTELRGVGLPPVIEPGRDRGPEHAHIPTPAPRRQDPAPTGRRLSVALGAALGIALAALGLWWIVGPPAGAGVGQDGPRSSSNGDGRTSSATPDGSAQARGSDSTVAPAPTSRASTTATPLSHATSDGAQHDASRPTATGEATSSSGADDVGAAAPDAPPMPNAEPRRPFIDVCHLHEDSYALLLRGKPKSRLMVAGACYACKAEKRASRTVRFQPRDCASWYVCAPADPGTCP